MTRSANWTTEQVWERFSGELHGFLLRRVRDPELAGELLQETFARVHAGLPSLRDSDRVLAWVHRIARNVLTDDHRRARRDPAPDARAVSDAPDHAEEADRRDDNDNALVGSWLIDMLDSLPDAYREALRLAELEGLTQREVAERLGLSVSGAKSRIQRGREMLRHLLSACCDVELDARGNVVDYRQRDATNCDDC